MEHRDRLNRLSESGGVGVPLEDYWKEFNSFDEGGQGEEDEEDISKTPDEGEAEEEWLREAGFENLVDSEMTEQDEVEFYEDILATLTARQIAVVKKRLDTVQMSKKRRVPRSRQRADVRELFNNASTSPPESLSTLHSEPLSMSMRMSMENSNLSTSAPVGERWTRKTTLPLQKSSDESPPNQQSSKLNTRALPPLTFLRTGHTGGFSLRDRTRGIDCESPTSVEVLKYESRKSTIQEKDTGSLYSLSSVSTEPFSLETGFQEISSRMNSVSDLVDVEKDLAALQRNSNVEIGDLGENDRTLVRSLAIIEVAALLDTYGLVPTRRRKPNRKKGKDNVVFGASLSSLLELDRRRCPGLKVPLIFQWILHHLHSNGLLEEGLMRLAGSVQKVQILKAEIEKHYVASPTLVENLIRQSSVHDVSVLLKQLVRHLPEPLLTNSHMDSFLQVPNIPNVQDQINTLNLLVLALPDSHREFLQELLYFLAKVVEEEDVNRMSIGNVAMIIAPNLFPPPRLKKGNQKQNDIAAEVTVAAMSSKVTQLLIKYGHFLGSVPPELLAQARLQNRRSSNKHAKKMGRKHKQKNMKDDFLHNGSSVIRVQMSSLRHPNSIAVPVSDKTTAGEVVERVAEALDQLVDPRHLHTFVSSEQQENRAFLQRPRTTSEPIVMRHRCLIGTKKSTETLKDHYLYFIRENVGERRLDHNISIQNIVGSGSGRFATGTTWEIRCHH